MTVTGIIAEFNPFHNGHKYLLDQAEGVKIVAMSGNFDGWLCGQAGTAGAEGVGLPDAPKQQQLESADPQSA